MGSGWPKGKKRGPLKEPRIVSETTKINLHLQNIGREVKPLEQRIHDNLIFPASGCWIWCGTTVVAETAKYGYYESGRICVKANGKWRMKLSHRVVYEFYKGSIEPGKELHHLCSETLCCNPEHLQPLTPAKHRHVSQAKRPKKLAS